MTTLQTLATEPEDPVFNHETDLFMASTMISDLGVCEFPDIWAFVAERMGGEETGSTADEVHQHFNKCLKNSELIQGEDGTKVFLGGEELIEHKYDVGELDAAERDFLLSQIDENPVGCYIRGGKILRGFSAFQNGAVEAEEDSDE